MRVNLRGDTGKGRVDEGIGRRDLPSTVGRKPDYAKRFVAAARESRPYSKN